MTQADAIKNQIQQAGQKDPAGKKDDSKMTIAKLFERMEPEIKRVLPKHITPERMTRIALTAIRQNPLLAKCDPLSLIAAVMTSSQLGLEPNTPLGEAYLIPYKNKRKQCYEAQFQMGYKGLLSLAFRTGQYKAIYAHEVYENDEFHFEYGLHKDLKHIPADEQEGEPIYYYAVYHLQNGGYDFTVWSKNKIQKHVKRYSQSADRNGSPWKSDFDSMAKKTVLKDVLKYAPKSIEFAKQLATDETVKYDISEDMTDVIDMTDYEDRNSKVIENMEKEKQDEKEDEKEEK